MALSPKEAAQARRSAIEAALHAIEDYIDGQLAKWELAHGIAVTLPIPENLFYGFLTWEKTFKWIKTTYEAVGWEISEWSSHNYYVSFRNPAPPA